MTNSAQLWSSIKTHELDGQLKLSSLVVLKSRRSRPFVGDFEGQGGKNVQPLPPVDHRVNFDCGLSALKAKKPLVDSWVRCSTTVPHCSVSQYFEALWRLPSTSITINWGPWYVSISLNKILQKDYLVISASGLGDDNSVSRVKRGRLSKKVWETLVIVYCGGTRAVVLKKKCGNAPKN